MSKWTAGPWQLQTLLSGSENDRGWRMVGMSGGQLTWIADISPVIYKTDPSDEGKANAKLIAMAPEMAEAIAEWAMFDSLCYFGDPHEPVERDRRKAVDALRKLAKRLEEL